MANKVIATNKEARYKYHIIETLEAGIALKGTEVKSLRENKVDLKDSFARIDEGEVYLYNAYISPYDKGSYANVEPKRIRKLLLHKKEINKISGKISQKGLTLVPVCMYFKDGRAKIELAVAKGKTLVDKREAIKKKDMDKQLRRAVSFRK